MSQQLTVNVPNSESEGKVEEKRETSAFFFEYISKRADKDQDMSVSNTNVIKQQKEEALKAVSDAAAAVKVASKLADLGDQIDARYQRQMEEIIDLTGNPETAYSTFLYVVENLFNWDGSGRATINLGRIAALMAYCYQLCKTYIIRKMANSSLIVSFMGLVSGWLFKFLIKAKFYEWLQNQGGWGQLILTTTQKATTYGGGVLILGGVVLLAFVAFSYYRSRN